MARPFDPRRIMEAMQREHRDVYGMDVPCPTCSAGIGKFCLKDGYSRHESRDDIAIHPARVALSRASRA